MSSFASFPDNQFLVEIITNNKILSIYWKQIYVQNLNWWYSVPGFLFKHFLLKNLIIRNSFVPKLNFFLYENFPVFLFWKRILYHLRFQYTATTNKNFTTHKEGMCEKSLQIFAIYIDLNCFLLTCIYSEKWTKVMEIVTYAILKWLYMWSQG